MSPVRVLIVDDSIVVRRLLTEILTAEADIEIVGSAGSASTAMSKLEQLKPDIVTLDVEMPGVSGLELLDQIRAKNPRIPVIMFSALTYRAGATTLEALARGATDYVTKPSGTDRAEAAEHVRRELAPRLRALGSKRESRFMPAVRPSAAPVSTAQFAPVVPPSGAASLKFSLRESPPDVLAIGCSTGGPNALTELFSGLPANLSVPIVIVQHMPPLFTKLLAERLSALGRTALVEAQDGEELVPGKGYIAPGGYHMRVARRGTRTVVALDQGPLVNSCRPAVDNLFESVADVFGANALAVVLTGMGQDGLRGSEQLRAKGAQIVVQDQATSVVWGMPGFVARANLAHAVLPLGDIAAEIIRRVRGQGRTSGRNEGYISVR